MNQIDGIAVVSREVTEGKVAYDERWSRFSTEELNALVDGMYNYESGIPSMDTCHNLCRTMLSELKRREKDGNV